MDIEEITRAATADAQQLIKDGTPIWSAAVRAAYARVVLADLQATPPERREARQAQLQDWLKEVIPSAIERARLEVQA